MAAPPQSRQAALANEEILEDIFAFAPLKGSSASAADDLSV